MLKTKRKGEPTLQTFDCVMKPVAPGTKSRARMMRGVEWEIPKILAEILTVGLARIQSLSKQQNHARCAIEAAHLQSLPALLAEFDPEALDRYWSTQRMAFIQKSCADDLTAFERTWAALSNVLDAR